MDDWFRLDADAAWALGGPLIVVAALLQAAAYALVPPERRVELRRTLVFAAIFLAMLALTWVTPSRYGTEWIQVVGLGSLLLIVARSIVVLLTESSLGRWIVPSLPRIVADLLQAALYAAAGLLTLRAAGMEPSSLLTTSALLTAVVGLALQETLGNVFAGLALQLGQPFEIGDWIEIENEPKNAGRVLEVSWRSTRLLTYDDVEIVVPNGAIARGLLRNASKPSPVARRTVLFSANYATAPERVHATVLAAIVQVPRVLDTPEPEVLTMDFASDGITYALRYSTVDHPYALQTDSLVRDRIWHALQRAGIVIPFPQRDVHLIPRDLPAERAAQLRKLEDTLAYVSLFTDLPESLLREMAEGAETRTYARGEWVVRQGEPGDELFVVAGGEVEVWARTADGQEMHLARLGVGDFFGEMSLLTGEVRSASVRARDQTTLVVLGHRAMRRVLHAHPELAERLTAMVVARNDARQVHVRSRAESEQIDADERQHQLLRRVRSFFER